jgi:hypothetical protein
MEGWVGNRKEWGESAGERSEEQQWWSHILTGGGAKVGRRGEGA